MRVLVTGATGLLGNNIVRAATGRGDEVLAVARQATGSVALRGLPVRAIDADIADMKSLRAAMSQGVDAVVHCAAKIHLGWTCRQESEQINVLGTQNVLQWASELGARCIHVSTVNVLPVGSPGQAIQEDTTGEAQIPCTYVLSKKRAEHEAAAAIGRGQDVVIVYPGFMLGPWDWKPSSARMIVELQGGAPPLSPSGGCSVCDARDVAQAVLAAIAAAPRGGRYILAGENWTYFRLWTEIATRLGCRKPWLAMRPLGRWLVGAVGDGVTRVSGREPVFNSAALRMGAQFHWYSSQRASQDLGYRTRPAVQSLDDTIEWLRGQGMLEPR